MLSRPRRPQVRLLLFLLALVVGLCAPSAAAEAPRLLSRLAPGPGASLELSADERAWLWHKRVLRVGVAQPDAAPFDILGNGQHYEGISAEYVRRVAEVLRLETQIVAFPDRQAALKALRAGDIDLLTAALPEETGQPGLVRSRPYVEDAPVVVRRADHTAGPAETPETIAVARGYGGTAIASQLTSGAGLVPTPSLLTGLAAVALGQVDAVLGDARMVAAQLAQSPLYGREQVRFLTPRPEGMAFLLRADDTRLLGLLDRSLAGTAAAWRRSVSDTWSHDAVRLREAAPVTLSASQRRWQARHPKVRVGYLRDFAPLTFEGERGEFRGLAADLLARIGQRTGLMFEAVAMGSHAELTAALARGDLDLAAAMADDAAEQAHLRKSRAWFSTVPVLVTKVPGGDSALLEKGQGETVLVPASLGLQPELAKRWPALHWEERATAQDALAALLEGRASAAVLPYMQARALLASTSNGSARIGAALPLPPRRYAFAVDREEPLVGILDRALMDFEPSVLADMSRRWRSEIHVQPRWPSQARWLLPAFTLAGVMLLLAVVWIRLLRRQVRKRRRAEQALTDQLAFMRVMIDGTPHPVYVRDCAGRLLDCNASYLAALGVERGDVIGEAVARIPLASDQMQEYDALYRKVLADGQPIVEDRHLRLRNGRQMTVFHWMLPYRASNEGIVGLIGGWVDITERQRLYDALQTAKEEADNANRAKSRFLATASHEIRTPMNAVLGMLELALRKADKGELDRLALKVASESASGLLELLNDILDISRIESGHLALNPRPVEVEALARRVVELYQVKAREKGLAMVLNVAPGAEGGVLLDALRFQQVLGNLLSNAIKFTPEGAVTITLSGERCDGELALRLVVEDTGIGIPKADLRRLCQPYQQAGNHELSGRTGAGLGLSISQHLCRLMGGGLELTSREGVGSRIVASLRLPACELSTEAPACNAVRTAQAPIDVLVVDDHEPNRLLLAQQLSYLGHRVTVAVDGAHGLREWCGRGGFEVVICDCEMPGLDGYDLARAIRLEEHRKGLLPCRLLACTADASGGQRERCREAGIDDCLTKPLGLEALAAALAPSPSPWVQAGPQQAHAGATALLGLAGGCSVSARRLRDSLVHALAQDYQRLGSLPEGSAEVDDVVHRVKGGARIVGAAALEKCCEAVERKEARLVTLLEEIQRLQGQLRAMRFSQGSPTEPGGPVDSGPTVRSKPAA